MVLYDHQGWVLSSILVDFVFVLLERARAGDIINGDAINRALLDTTRGEGRAPGINPAW